MVVPGSGSAPLRLVLPGNRSRPVPPIRYRLFPPFLFFHFRERFCEFGEPCFIITKTSFTKKERNTRSAIFNLDGIKKTSSVGNAAGFGCYIAFILSLVDSSSFAAKRSTCSSINISKRSKGRVRQGAIDLSTSLTPKGENKYSSVRERRIWRLPSA